MKFTVLIPAYNCAKTIRKTVDSVRQSGLSDYEILLVDDGSTDDTASVLDNLKKQFANVVVVTKENGGVSSARNQGILQAKGEYLICIDADDILEKNAYCEIVDLIDQYKPDMLLFGMYFDYYNNGVLYQSEALSAPEEGVFTANEIDCMLPDLFRCNYLSPVWNKVFRREMLVRNGIRFSESLFLMEDCLFSLSCLSRCERVFLYRKPVYHYVLSEDGKLAKRLRRINSLSEYMKPFLELPQQYAGLTRSIYYMLLRQRISVSIAKNELSDTAQDLIDSVFRDPAQEDTPDIHDLLTNNFAAILRRNRKRRLRHKLAVTAKTVRCRLHGNRTNNA